MNRSATTSRAVRRVPVLATIIVAVAILLMVALGVWQLRRAGEKEALLATLAANPARPPIAMPQTGPVLPDALYRRASVTCVGVTGWRTESGRNARGVTGYRRIAECQTPNGRSVLVDLGVARDFRGTPDWRGGTVSGIVATEPDHRSLIGGLVGPQPVLRPLLIADRPAPGLQPTARPTIADVPNNHRGYAGQWFLFAAIAAVIYALVLRRRAQG